MIPVVLSRITIIVLSSKVSQDLTFIIRTSRDVDDTGFRFALQAIYISFSALAITLSRRRVSLIRVIFSSLMHSVIITVGICTGRFFIIRFYYTFVNTFCNLRTIKHSNSLFKRNGFAIKALNIGLFRLAIR